MTGRRLLVSALAASAACLFSSIAPPAHAQKAYGPGITDKEILMGQTMPYSGPISFAALNGTGDLAFLKMLNEQGGINGRQLRLISLDDGYVPPKTLEQTRKMVEQDRIAFLYGSLGTAPNSAIGKYITDRKIPHILFNTGTDKFYSGEYPTMIPYFPRYGYQAEVLAKWILKEKPDAKIVFLYQNDDFGANFIEGTKRTLGERAKNVVKEVSFEVRDPSVDSQVISLAETKADIFFIASVPGRPVGQAIRKAADLGWKPIFMLPNTTTGIETVLRPAGLENAVGAIAAPFMKDPSDPSIQDDPDVKAWNAWIDKYVPGGDKRNNSLHFPYIKGWILKDILERAGDNLTRENILKMATTMPKMTLPLMLPGVTIEGTPEFKTMRIVRFDGQKWVTISEPMTAGQ
jgi:ABC-type branched-subunit amino acid transport system substrate-binding protein